ncbi:hypothetical protein IPM62_00255 [Candidatus Woesebacteria bacterium]|nr:MAG: hypothetical protein IPM62_00255 [Candidatus Woesebacteria bacterium]
MDYHFIVPKDKPEKRRYDLKIVSFTKKLLPVFLLAAILPAFIFFITTPPNLRFSPQAQSDAELRLWFEPGNVVVSRGNEVDLKVIAMFESDSLIIPSIAINIASNGIITKNQTIDYQRPFKGQVELGVVTVLAEESGNISVEIPLEDIQITAFDKPLQIFSSPAQIVVK